MSLRRTLLVAGLGLALVAGAAVTVLRSSDDPATPDGTKSAPERRLTRTTDVRRLARPTSQALLASRGRTLARGKDAGVTLQLARSSFATGVRDLVADLDLPPEQAGRLDALRTEAVADLDDLRTRLEAQQIEHPAAQAEVDRVRAELIDGATKLLGREHADAVVEALGDPTAPGASAGGVERP